MEEDETAFINGDSTLMMIVSIMVSPDVVNLEVEADNVIKLWYL